MIKKIFCIQVKVVPSERRTREQRFPPGITTSTFRPDPSRFSSPECKWYEKGRGTGSSYKGLNEKKRLGRR